MFRHVALIWNAANPAARRDVGILTQRLRLKTAPWRAALAQEGLVVYCADIRPGSSEMRRLQDDAGVVLGTLFTRDSDGISALAPLVLGERESSAIAASAGRRLLERYWGRYVAFLRDPVSGAVRILRDPTAALPCFLVQRGAVTVSFSDMEEGARLGVSFSVNWPYVAAQLCLGPLQVEQTALRGVSQVVGGECLEIAGDRRSRQLYWNPLQFAAADTIEDVAEATRLLRDCVRDCVHAWAGAYSGIVHMLSGGVDSSIVAACLKDAPSRPRLVHYNQYSPGSNSDERAYARLAAAAAGGELVEEERASTAVTLELMLRPRKSCIPVNAFYYLGTHRGEIHLARARQAPAVFMGYGGDQLFYQQRAIFAATDYLRRHGIDRRWLGVALHAARMDRLSIWKVLREALLHGGLRRPWDLQKAIAWPHSLVREEVVSEASRSVDFLHPWQRSPGSALPGTLFKTYQLLTPIEFCNPFSLDGDPELTTPLYSQPLFELVMRIPTWVLTHGGWDRSIARRAFESDLPRALVTRRTKGGMEEHARTVLLRNFALVRELLHEGMLVKERILDPGLLAGALSGDATRLVCYNTDFFFCLSVEAWLRGWCAARERRAPAFG